MNGKCDKCFKITSISPSHVGRKHQACGRKKGSGSSNNERKDCGIWRQA